MNQIPAHNYMAGATILSEIVDGIHPVHKLNTVNRVYNALPKENTMGARGVRSEVEIRYIHQLYYITGRGKS